MHFRAIVVTQLVQTTGFRPWSLSERFLLHDFALSDDLDLRLLALGQVSFKHLNLLRSFLTEAFSNSDLLFDRLSEGRLQGRLLYV